MIHTLLNTVKGFITNLPGSGYKDPFDIDSNGVLVRYHGNEETVILPNHVKVIGPSAFAMSSLKQIVIPDHVTEIGDGAFYGSALRYIVMSSNVVYVGRGAFMNCQLLETVMLSNSLRELSSGLFSGCQSLKSVAIPAGVSVIGDSAFSHCRKLKSVTWSPELTTIGKEAFSECVDLTSVFFPKTLSHIGESAFSRSGLQGCVNLSECHLVSIEKYVFDFCYDIAEVLLPHGLKVIGSFSFHQCIGLRHVVIPDTVTHIDVSAFKGAFSLSEIEVPLGIQKIGYQSFASSQMQYLLCTDEKHKAYVKTQSHICLPHTAMMTYLEYLGKHVGISTRAQLSPEEQRLIYRSFRSCELGRRSTDNLFGLSASEQRDLKNILTKNTSKDLSLKELKYALADRSEDFIKNIISRFGRDLCEPADDDFTVDITIHRSFSL